MPTVLFQGVAVDLINLQYFLFRVNAAYEIK